MNELQIVIATAAAGVLAWIVFVNVREYRATKKLIAEQPQAKEPVFTSAQPERRPDADPPSEFADAVAILKWSTPISVIRVQQQIRGWRRVGTKPLVVGWVSADQLLAEPIGLEVSELRIGVLLATRSGPLHAMEYSEWRNSLDQIAQALGATLEVPPMTVVLARAKELDQRCAAVDAQLSMCIATDRVLSLAEIQSAASQAGLQAKSESRFVAVDQQQQQRYSVFPGDNGSSLVLLLDVPRTTDPTEAMRDMRKTAMRLAEILSGQLADEQGRPLNNDSLDVIENQVAQRADALTAMGVVPGSVLALRLFL
jgi:hypothetical protein